MTSRLASSPSLTHRHDLASRAQEMGALLRRWYLQFVREPANVVLTFIQPAVWLVFFGGGMGRLVRPGLVGGTNYIGFALPGVIAFTVIGGAISGAVPLLWDKETGYLGKLLSMPIARYSVLVSRLVFLAAVTAVQIGGILVVAIALGVRVAAPPVSGLLVVVLGVLLAVALASIFLALALHGPGHNTFFTVSGFITLPLLLTSNAFVPIAAMPTWMGWVARLNPLTYTIESSRAVILAGSGTIPLGDVVMLVMLTLFCVGVAVQVFRRYAGAGADG
jgi:ABC-2 type transport system permease protein